MTKEEFNALKVGDILSSIDIVKRSIYIDIYHKYSLIGFLFKIVEKDNDTITICNIFEENKSNLKITYEKSQEIRKLHVVTNILKEINIIKNYILDNECKNIEI